MAKQLIQYPQIIISRGATKIIIFDLSFVKLHGGSIVFTIKNRYGEIVKEVTMTTEGVNRVILKDEETAKMLDDVYFYDLMFHGGDERFAQCLPSIISVVDSVGGY